MPRYFFHMPNYPDSEGTDLPHDTAARTAACETLGRVIIDGCDDCMVLRVIDDAGNSIALLNYTVWHRPTKRREPRT